MAKWVITTSGKRPIAEIAKELKAAGLSGGKVMKEIGVVTGSADRAALDKLRKVSGVTDVAPDEEIDLGPPDAKETW